MPRPSFCYDSNVKTSFVDARRLRLIELAILGAEKAMGLPIANIHSPSVDPSTLDNGIDQHTSLDDLVAQKKRLEAELDALGDVLKSHNINMNTTLTTIDGFPRADVDVPQIRTTRTRIIHLRNDHKALMSRIEKALHSHFASRATNSETVPSSTQNSGRLTSEPIQNLSEADPTFAKVNSVVHNSPAETAGLKVGDRIQSFDEVNWLNHEKLGQVARIVSEKRGQRITVTILRNDNVDGEWTQHRLVLVPRSDWGGRGLLGCHLMPE